MVLEAMDKSLEEELEVAAFLHLATEGGVGHQCGNMGCRSGRIHLLMAWVRIPQVTTYALTIFFGCVGGRREEETKPQNLFKGFYFFFSHTHTLIS